MATHRITTIGRALLGSPALYLFVLNSDREEIKCWPVKTHGLRNEIAARRCI